MSRTKNPFALQPRWANRDPNSQAPDMCNAKKIFGAGRRSFNWTNRYRLALPKNRQATYPLTVTRAGQRILYENPASLLGLAGGGVYRADAVTSDAVRSYRTFSPLPVPAPTHRCRPSAVYFLWHWPAGHPGWPLAITVPCPARTFLPAPALRSKAKILNSNL